MNLIDPDNEEILLPSEEIDMDHAVFKKPEIISYSTDQSTCCMVVRLAMIEMGLEYQIKHIELYDGDHITPEYAQINPKMTVPSMSYNGKIITDSKEIVKFLQDEHLLEALLPVDKEQRIDVLDFVDEFYEKFDHIEGYTLFYSPFDHREQLRLMGENNPDLKDIVEAKEKAC